ncbi:MAG: CoA transferase [Candidatus Lambdaproteobacteria bacterium]|nr:CoA transferase [Candidatus Lambdaproteobacteria bacterium]
MDAGLAGVQVLELGGGVAAPLAGKLMADLGATVVKIEPPAGDPARRRGPFPGGRPQLEASGTFLYLNAGKRSLTADLTSAAGRAALDALAARADLLVHNLTRREMAAQGLDFERLATLNPRLVMVSITPFGLTGPYADCAAEELNLAHGGGWGSICPGPGIDPALPPIKPFGQHAFVQAGTHAAVAGLAAHFGAARSGVGEHIDFSVQEIVATIIGRPTSGYVYTGKVESRLKTRSVAPNGFFRCKDGNQVFLFTSEEDQWARLVELMGNPAWAQDERWVTRETRAEHEVELRRHLEPWVAGWNAADIFRACQVRRICCTRAYTYPQLLEDEHLRARGYPTPHRHPVVGELMVPGAPYLLRHKWWRLRGPAPRLGEADAEAAQGAGRLFPAPGTAGAPGAPSARPATGTPLSAGAEGTPPPPLAGVRVLDLTWVWAGPHCCFLLANLGADVIKVESADRPDRFRRAYYPKGMAPGVNRSGAFNHLGQGKRSVSVKLSTPEGRALVKRMASECDVVVSNFGTGVMERLELGAEALLAMKPELIVATISGFGQTGPLKNYMGYGGPITALSGISLATGFRPGQPGEVGTAYGDPNAGGYTAFAIVAALEARRRHGGGQEIDVSLWEAMAASGFEGWMNHTLGNPPHQPMGNRDPFWAPHNVYRCAGDDRWVSIAVAREAQWQGLCGAIGRPDLAGDPRFRDAAARKANEDALDALLAGWCAGQDEWAVTDRLQAAGVPAFPSLNGKDLTENPHLAARHFWERWPHPEVGTLPLASVPWRLTRRPSGTRGRAPLLGEHTDAVLSELLALPPAEIGRLRQAGILG